MENTISELIEKKQVLSVHSAAIHIENKVGLKQRQAWFYLLYRAFPYLENQRSFFIHTSELKKAINYTSKNNEHLKDILENLVTTSVKWNIFDKIKGETWGISGLLAYCEIANKTGICEYQFSEKLQSRFLNPSMYVKLNLLISKRFTSKHSLAIYCLALDYLNLKNNYGEKNLSIEEIRKYLGLEDDKYLRVVDIHRRILKKAEIDINSYSDMKISIIPNKPIGKKITGFKLQMSIKEEFLDFYKPKKLEEQLNRQPNFFDKNNFIEAPEDKIKKSLKEKKEIIKINNTEVKKFYAEHKISITTDTVQNKLKEIIEMFQANFEDYLLFLMSYAKQESNKKAITSLSGFYIGLLKDDSQLDNYVFYIQKQIENEQNKKHKLKQLVENELDNRYEKFIFTDFEKYLEKNIDKLESKMIKLIESRLKGEGFLYDVLIMKYHNGKIDKTLITASKPSVKSSIVKHLNSYKDELGFKTISFDEWKRQLTEKYLHELESEIEKSLNS